MRGLLWGLGFIVFAFIVGWIRHIIMVAKLQALLDKDYFAFSYFIRMGFGEAGNWKFSDSQIPGAMKLMYHDCFGEIGTAWLKYNGNESLLKAIKKLIAQYESYQ